MISHSTHLARIRLMVLAVLLSGVSVAACDSSTEEERRIAGEYGTVQFTAEIEGETMDVLGAGGFIEMTLREDETVSGRLFIPEALAGDEENDFSLDGTYVVSGDVVTFDHEADTFIRGVEWIFENGTLRTETGEISVVLQQE